MGTEASFRQLKRDMAEKYEKSADLAAAGHEYSALYHRVKKERDELAAELERTTAIKNQVVKNCNEWRGIAQDRTEELDRVADQLSDVWLRLDEWARSSTMPPIIKDVCRDILIEQQAPGWKDGE